MKELFKNFIMPILKLKEIRRILDIVGEPEKISEELNKFCIKMGKTLVMSDIYEKYSNNKLLNTNPYYYNSETDINEIPNIGMIDVVFIHCDYNWYFVWEILKKIEKIFDGDNLPLIFVFGTDWKTARRDSYLQPELIPEEFCHSYQKKGIKPGKSELCEDEGYDKDRYHAEQESGESNGVLTAIEDFIGNSRRMIDMYILPISNEVTFLVEKNRRTFTKIANEIFSEEYLINILCSQWAEENENNTDSTYQKLLNDLKCTNRKLELLKKENLRLQGEAELYKNSVRYRMSTAIIEAMHSPKKTLSLPSTLLKIKGNNSKDMYLQNKIKKKEKIKEEVLEKSIYSKRDIIDWASQHLRCHNYKFKNMPLISIIIITHNGLDKLKTLFESISKTKFYSKYEIIIVDNASTDGSIKYIKTYFNKFKISIIENERNFNFSEACNQGAKKSKGDYLLFLNNDIEVINGWLDEMLITALDDEKSGVIGCKLIYPKIPKRSPNHNRSFLLQHGGICFKEDQFFNQFFIRPYNVGKGKAQFLDDATPVKRAAITAAAFLLSKKVFYEVGGFDEDYIYGYEDVDLCLKVYRAGYNNYYCPTSLLFHHEFGTQSKVANSDIVKRRQNNCTLFKKKWEKYLIQHMLEDKINGTNFFIENNQMVIAFAVTESIEETTAGDYFTAMEFATYLNKLGYKIKYLSRKGKEDWYDVGKDVDVIVSMLDVYNLNKIYNAKETLIKIGWARNWFVRWCEQSFFREYDIVLASSKTACEYIELTTGIKPILFPIATNHHRFINEVSKKATEEEKEKYSSDYVFTGNYWNDPREIIDIIEPENIPYKFKIFGANWNQIEKFKPYTQGFVTYYNMPKVYKYSEIVIDDANRVTKEFGAVNSRVFDALAAGKLVLTNGVIGAYETFNGKLPSFSTQQELEDKLIYFMENEVERKLLVSQLQKFVLENHTYEVRARDFINIIRNSLSLNEKGIDILIGTPKWEEAHLWGDYHFAEAMKRCFENMGYTVEIVILSDWNLPSKNKYRIVLRGLSKYIPEYNNLNIMWNISHPELVTLNEYEEYDKVFIASEIWAKNVNAEIKKQVECLMQCTDFDNSNIRVSNDKKFELLFVGNSRKVYRKIIKDLLPTIYDLSVFGSDWEQLIPINYIKGQSIPNEKVGQAYQDAAIVLNDHWDDMRERGFVSNRIYDALAVGAFVISDTVKGMDIDISNCIITYENREELKNLISYYLEHPEKRNELARKGQEIIKKKHTFANRTKTILEHMSTIYIR